MNGVHDMGGMDGFGKVAPDAHEVPFPAEWQARSFALNRVMGSAGEWNIDVGRYWIETLPPAVYLSSSYYRKWFLRLERLCLHLNLVSERELASGHSSGPGRPLKRQPLSGPHAGASVSRPNHDQPPRAPAAFAVGEKVRARKIHPRSHTRLPRFARGHVGVIERIQGCHTYPDAMVEKGVRQGEWLYTVVFDGTELWGPDAEDGTSVSIEAFEPYLERP
ncbi:nitrile hydratase subunit beta [Reyranella sp.]|uniref:nitrile hydratase subunit beta n=1 Tax=Reyranella sp. TaxID=1929291 RepID=UPI003F6EA837